MKELSNIFAPSRCLSAEQLIGYCENKLPAQDRIAVEKHLVNCEICSDAVEGLASSTNVDKSRHAIGSLNRELHKRYSKAPSEKRTTRIYYAIAALVVIGLISIISLSQKNHSHKSLFVENFKPYPNIIPLVRGEEGDSLLQGAMVEYERGR
ncbi:zf-HC2 domain-containing protein, partial [bacterium]|nr:zf-HC2 domain-containing protein [bacterium]